MINDYFEPFCRVNEAVQLDLYGGEKRVYTDGETFQAGLAGPPTRAERRDAEKVSLDEKYTIFLPLDSSITKGDKVKQLASGRVFRVLSYLYKTPAVSYMQYAVADCEVVSL